MNNNERLKARFVELYAVSSLQRSLRLLPRAFWMGAAGGMLAWGANALWGVLPHPASWVFVGLAFALVPVIAIWAALFPVLFSLAPHKQWIWRVDRRLGMREQFSTAWEVAERGESGPVASLLVQEMLHALPRARRRLLKGAWFNKIDLFASLLAVMMVCFLLAAMLLQPNPANRAQEPAAPGAAPEQAAPPEAGEQPGAGQSDQGETGEGGEGGEGGESGGAEGEGQPGEGQGGEQPPGGGGQGEGQDSTGGQSGESGSQDGQPGADTEALSEALREMGRELSRQAGTYELGQALENLDMERAAEELEDLGDQLSELSPESRANMSEAMRDAAEDARQAGDQELGEELDEAADTLSNRDPRAGQAMENLAEALRDRAGQMEAAASSAPGAGQGPSPETGLPEPIRRLQNENGRFELPLNPAAEPHLISPAPPDVDGEGTAGGALDSSMRQGAGPGQNPLLPGSVLWKWRNVVSEYFQR